MNKSIIFIAPAYQEEIHDRVFVESILNQTNKNYKAIVWHNGLNTSMSEWLQDMNNGLYMETPGYVQYKESANNSGNYGCANRQQAIDECTTDYIIQTSVSDYWLPQAVEYILKSLEQSPDLLIWNSVNHLVGPCQVLDSQIAWAKIDWGNFALRTDIARKVRIKQDQYCADWLYIQQLLAEGHIDTKKILKLNAILTIHN